jgi:hypothetical protein
MIPATSKLPYHLPGKVPAPYHLSLGIVNDGPEKFTDDLGPEKQNGYGGGSRYGWRRKKKTQGFGKGC